MKPTPGNVEGRGRTKSGPDVTVGPLASPLPGPAQSLNLLGMEDIKFYVLNKQV